MIVQVFEDHQDSIHNIAAFANKKFEAFEEFSGQVSTKVWVTTKKEKKVNKQTNNRQEFITVEEQFRLLEEKVSDWKKMQTSPDFIKIVKQLI